MKSTFRIIFTFSALFLGGCLLSTNPFYGAGSVRANERLLGSYISLDRDVVYQVEKTDAAGIYVVTVVEKAVRSEYTAVSFLVGERTFIDISAKNVPAPPLDPAGPTVSEYLKRVTAKGRHAVLRVEMNDTGLTLAMPRPPDLKRLFAVEPKLKRSIPEEFMTVIEESTDVLGRLLASYGQDDNYFVGKMVLNRNGG